MPSVLRASEVQFQGPVQLGLDSTTAPATATAPETVGCAPEQARARIVENHPDFALVELTCPCGRTTYVRCEYAQAAASAVGGEPGPQ